MARKVMSTSRRTNWIPKPKTVAKKCAYQMMFGGHGADRMGLKYFGETLDGKKKR